MTTINIERLFEPITINGLTLSNRFVVPAMQQALSRDGDPTSDLADFYSSRVAGGAGLVITESTAIDHWSANWQPMATRLWPSTLASWKSMVDGVKNQGGKIFVQLWHPGSMRTPPEGKTFERESLSPSGLASGSTESGRPMTRAEMIEIRDAYVSTAVAAKGLGCDGVEVHGAHGYLLDQFLWADTNVRDDEWGGAALENRLRFPAEVVRAIRHAVGPDFPIGYRLSQWKEIDFDGKIAQSPQEFELILKTLRDAGVDLFNVSVRRFDTPEWDGSDLGLAGWAKTFTDAPVITVGGVGLTSDLASELWEGAPTKNDTEATLARLITRFDNGEFDLVAVGRAHLADGEWVSKVREGRYDEILSYSPEILLKIAAGWSDAPGDAAHSHTVEEAGITA
ncbi:unannotated protein [freshwater metagenome]|uniref:Unannotated protein n=1 Tax=freshwater metagenome TaxID=449393 RepID=A0A6J7HM31_9ZZZZ|nr:12-oxophytodienoate reductase [Actinomycetota bacterium]